MPMLTIVLAATLLTSCAAYGTAPSPEPPPTQEPVWDLAPQFEFASGFSDEVALVQTGEDLYKFIDYNGKNVFGKTFVDVEWFSREKLFADVFPSVLEHEGELRYQIGRDGTALPAVEEEIATLEKTPIHCSIATLTNGQEGLLDKKGQWAIPPEYEDVYLIDATQVRVRQEGRCGFLASDGSVVLAPEGVWSIEEFDEGYALVTYKMTFEKGSSDKERYNFIDESGKLLLSRPIIQNTLERKPSISVPDQRITYAENGLYGFKDLTGEVVVPPTFVNAGRFRDGLAAVTNDKGQIGYVDVTGALSIPYRTSSYGGEFQNGLASFKERNGKSGIIDKTGAWVIRPNYFFCSFVEKYNAWILRRNDLASLGDDEEDIYFAESDLLIKGLVNIMDACPTYVVGQQGDYDILVTIDGTKTSWHQFDYIVSFSEGLAPVEEDGVYGYIDTTGNWVFRPQFESARPYSEGRAAVCLDGKWGYILPPTNS